MRLLMLTLLLGGLLAEPASAQAPPTPAKDSEALAMTVAMSGIVLTAAGYAIILHRDTLTGSDPVWVAGGIAVVAGGVTMTWIGLHHLTIAPSISPHGVGVKGTIRWGS